MDPITIALLSSALGGLASAGTGHFLGRRAQRKDQKAQRKEMEEQKHLDRMQNDPVYAYQHMKGAYTHNMGMTRINKYQKKELKQLKKEAKKFKKRGGKYEKHGKGSRSLTGALAGLGGFGGGGGNNKKFLNDQLAFYEKFHKKFGKQKVKEIQPEKLIKAPTMEKSQENLLNYINEFAGKIPQERETANEPLYQEAVNQLRERLSGTPEAYERFKAPVLSEFKREIIPTIANNFSQVGAQRSSGFQNALASAGQQLSEKLGAMRAGLQESALNQALSYAQVPGQERQNQIQQRLQAGQLGLGARAFENIYRPATHLVEGGFAPPGVNYPQNQISGGGGGAVQRPGFFGTLGSNIASGLGQGVGQGIAGGVSGAIGKGIENLFKPGQANVVGGAPAGINNPAFVKNPSPFVNPNNLQPAPFLKT